jgi:hypothetical protein
MKIIKAKLLTPTLTPDFLYHTRNKTATHINLCWSTRSGLNYNEVTVPLTDVELVEVESEDK